jgi:SH3-like domain-containing protein
MSVARFALIGEAEDVLRLVTIRSTDDLWPNVNPSSGPSGRLAQHRAWRGIVSGVQARVTRTAEWRRLRRAEGQLASLNDRMLEGRGASHVAA